MTQVVNKANTVRRLRPPLSPTVFGQAVTFTATVSVVSPGSTAVASPTGTVTFYDNGTSIGTGTLSVVNGHDQATFITSNLVTATHPITAAYTSGDGNFNASPSSAVHQPGRQPGQHDDRRRASPGVANVGQTVTFTATVTANAPGSGTLDRDRRFLRYDDQHRPHTRRCARFDPGTATFATTSLAGGHHIIKATYSGRRQLPHQHGTRRHGHDRPDDLRPRPFGRRGAEPLRAARASTSRAASTSIPARRAALSASGNPSIKAVRHRRARRGPEERQPLASAPRRSPAPPVVADPLASLPLPSTSGLTKYGSENLAGNSSATIKPGIYSSISVSGSASLTLSSGTYIIEGGGFSVSGAASVTGSGVHDRQRRQRLPQHGRDLRQHHA